MAALSLVTKGMLCKKKIGEVYIGGGGGGVIYRDQTKKLTRKDLEKLLPKVVVELLEKEVKERHIEIKIELFQANG